MTRLPAKRSDGSAPEPLSPPVADRSSRETPIKLLTAPAADPCAPDASADDRWLELAIAGDDVAFAWLFRLTQPRLLRYATGLVGQEASDVTAEAWLQIARDVRKFKGDLNDFRAWSARIVRNRAMDLLRAQARRPRQVADLGSLLNHVDPADTVALVAENLSTTAAIELIRSLPREQAEAVLLRAVVGLDAAHAGRVLGKSAGAVRVAAHRGLKTLAKTLAATDRRPEA